MTETTPQREPQALRARRERLQALLFHGAAIGATLLMGWPYVKLPQYTGES